MAALRRLLTTAAVAGLTMTGCGSDSTTVEAEGSAGTEAATAPATISTEPGSTEPTSAEPDTADTADTTDTTEERAQEAVALAPWQQLTVDDVDGVPFTLGDFTGTPVFVETFATWCPNCRQQLADTNEAAAGLGDDAVVLALSTETDLPPGDVAAYATENGFDHVRFAVMTPELLAALTEALGTSAANPPATPHFVIDATGRAGELTTGFSSVEDITASIEAASA